MIELNPYELLLPYVAIASLIIGKILGSGVSKGENDPIGHQLWDTYVDALRKGPVENAGQPSSNDEISEELDQRIQSSKGKEGLEKIGNENVTTSDDTSEDPAEGGAVLTNDPDSKKRAKWLTVSLFDEILSMLPEFLAHNLASRLSAKPSEDFPEDMAQKVGHNLRLLLKTRGGALCVVQSLDKLPLHMAQQVARYLNLADLSPPSAGPGDHQEMAHCWEKLSNYQGSSALSANEVAHGSLIEKIDDCSKRRLQKIIGRIADYKPMLGLDEEYVELAQGLKNRDDIVLPANLAKQLAKLKSGKLSYRLDVKIGRHLAQVLLGGPVNIPNETLEARWLRNHRQEAMMQHIVKALETPSMISFDDEN
ncbi:uncharacterized protein BXIN_2131 [Babesia sp. Xinjiang]|uniref:uncharacterized protein n=1 Tax=Babesia sp. Xinjiang TaxID=462227 RepID=UPI000A25D05B|nr:uncharacterized protein BXIN_2131 [Babesia sp. Xinjiang]ORM40532.1 hypothetical protein BXIN_2131 [Babesia sp. Xinjiang]